MSEFDAGVWGLRIRHAAGLPNPPPPGSPRAIAFLARMPHGYVAAIDQHDGATDYCDAPREARIFRGQEWLRFWAEARAWIVACDPETGAPV